MAGENKVSLWVLYGNEENLDPKHNWELWRLFFVAQSVMGRVRDLELAAVGITPEQSGALFLLSRRGKSTIAEMAEAWCRQRNSVSTLMDRMAKQGLVKKVKIPLQRDLEIQITPKGREMLNLIIDTAKVFDMTFTQFTEEDRQDFARCLKMILSRCRGILESNLKKNQVDNIRTSG